MSKHFCKQTRCLRISVDLRIIIIILSRGLRIIFLALTMEMRRKELCDLKSFTQNIETEVTMLLQSLQWDRRRLLEGVPTAICQYDSNHRVPKHNLKSHENTCVLRSLGYIDNEELLPDPPDEKAHTLVKLSDNDIQKIINEASLRDPLFKKVNRYTVLKSLLIGLDGIGPAGPQPRSLPRLQRAYSADERRAIHDAVVAAVPSCHDLGDLALASVNENAPAGSVAKSRVEILAELRDMKRRRTKYRVAPKTKNYSDVLRDVIKTQMESYTEAIANTSIKTEKEAKQSYGSDYYKSLSKSKDTITRPVKYSESRENNKHRRDHSITAKKPADTLYQERRLKEEKHRKETSSKPHDNEHDRSNSRKRQESPRQNNSKDYDFRYEQYKSTSRHSNSIEGPKSHRDHEGHRSHRGDEGHRNLRDHDCRYKTRVDKQNVYRYDTTTSERSHKRKDRDYKYDDRVSGSKAKERIDDEAINTPKSNRKYSNQRDSKSEQRSSSRGRDRESRKRKLYDDDYDYRDDRGYNDRSEHVAYKRYYAVKKEDP